jgi:hypothetical protein
LSLSAPTTAERPVTLLSYLDVVLIVLAAPIMLLIGVPAAGYLIATAVWIVLRAIGVAVGRYAAASGDAGKQISARLGYMLGRLFVLAMTVVLVRNGSGKDDGLTALVVIVFAFTAQMATSALTPPRAR